MLPNARLVKPDSQKGSGRTLGYLGNGRRRSRPRDTHTAQSERPNFDCVLLVGRDGEDSSMHYGYCCPLQLAHSQYCVPIRMAIAREFMSQVRILDSIRAPPLALRHFTSAEVGLAVFVPLTQDDECHSPLHTPYKRSSSSPHYVDICPVFKTLPYSDLLYKFCCVHS